MSMVEIMIRVTIHHSPVILLMMVAVMMTIPLIRL